MLNTKTISPVEMLCDEVTTELTHNILPYWMNKMVDEEHGGFYGRRNGEDELIPMADKAVILNTRILWTFAHAARTIANPQLKQRYQQTATRAYDYVVKYFIDPDHGGLYWIVNFEGKPVYTKKQVYAQAFGIYALSEYYLASGNHEALRHAIELFNRIETHSFDKTFGGYLEAFDREWKLLDDLRLSDKDANERKTMNTHLHVLEAYTNLYRCWQNSNLQGQLKKLISIFEDKIIGSNNHLQLFFDDQWNVKSSIISFGHDIEASWLLQEAAEVLNDKVLLDRISARALKIVVAVKSNGLNKDGALMNEVHGTGELDSDIHWWPQAEALVGFFNAWQSTGDKSYLTNVITLWDFIKSHVVDAKQGEWHWRLTDDLSIVRTEDKAGPWKCPYHNGRACMEIIKRLKDEVNRN